MSLDAARVLFRVSALADSGALLLDLDGGPPSGTRVRIELERGWVYAIGVPPRWPRPEEELLALLRGRLTAASFLAGETPLRLGRCQPFHPAVTVRNYVEQYLDAQGRGQVELGPPTRQVRLLYAPHPTCLGFDERPVIRFLEAAGTTGRTLGDLTAARLAVPGRLARLLAFLLSMEAVALASIEPTPYELLGISEDASDEDARRAFKRLARNLHPDAHPHAPPELRRELEGRFAVITEAYRKLFPMGGQ